MTGQPIARVRNVSHDTESTSRWTTSPSTFLRASWSASSARTASESRLCWGLSRACKKFRPARSSSSTATWPTGNLARDTRPRCLYAAGSGEQPLPDALRVREHRFLRSPVRTGRGGASHAHHRASDRHGMRSSKTPCRQAFRRHEAEAEPLLRAHQRPRPAHPRRADDRRRPPLARPVLGPHQLDPRAPAADERDRRHRLYGRSRTLRLADGDGRRQDHRHRRPAGIAGQDRRAQSRRSFHRDDARSQARPAQEGRRAPACGLAGRNAGDRGGRPHTAVRRLRRGRSRQFQNRSRRDLRLPRLERLRQVDDDEDARRLPAGEQRLMQAVRPAHGFERHAGPAQRRVHDAGLLALRRVDGRAESRPSRPALSPAA